MARHRAAALLLLVCAALAPVRARATEPEAPAGAAPGRAADFGVLAAAPSRVSGGAERRDSDQACEALSAERQFLWPPIGELDVFISFSLMGDAYYHAMLGALAVVLPHAGLSVRAGEPGLVLSWPLTYEFGPVAACSRAAPIFGRVMMPVRSLRGHRVVLEPGVTIGGARSFFVRPGYQYVLHRSTWPLGLGAGVGSTLTLSGGESFRASVSPELVLHLGACCAPGYTIVTARWDRYFSGAERAAWLVSFGLAYW